MTPEQRERLVRASQRMTPEQRRAVTDGLATMNKLPVERKGPVRRELNSLRGMTPEERVSRLEGDEFKAKFNAEERQLLGDLAKAIPAEK